MLITVPSLELNWLSSSYKQMSPPDVYVIPEISYYASGLYYNPKDFENHEVFLYKENGEELTSFKIGKNGTIVVADLEEGYVQNTIAHEFRHHIQFQKLGWIYNQEELGWEFVREQYEYWDAIRIYFSHNMFEYDALLYSNTKYPCDYTLEWQDHVNRYIEDRKKII